MGAIEAIVQREVVTKLDEWAPGRNRVVHFETLCADPLKEFRQLYEFTELAWDDGVETRLDAMTTGRTTDSTSDAWGTQRDTTRMATAWRERISADDLAVVMDTWRRHGGDDSYTE